MQMNRLFQPKQSPLIPTGELKARLERCALLEERRNCLERLRYLQLEDNAAVRVAKLPRKAAEESFSEWQEYQRNEFPRSVENFKAWVERINSDDPGHLSAIAGEVR